MDFIKTRDLEIGKCYTQTKNKFLVGTELEGFREVYVYLGRTDSRNFLWGYVGHPKHFLENPEWVADTYWKEKTLYDNLRTTKNNKKVSKFTFEGYLPINNITLNFDKLSDETKDRIEKAVKYR